MKDADLLRHHLSSYVRRWGPEPFRGWGFSRNSICPRTSAQIGWFSDPHGNDVFAIPRPCGDNFHEWVVSGSLGDGFCKWTPEPGRRVWRARAVSDVGTMDEEPTEFRHLPKELQERADELVMGEHPEDEDLDDVREFFGSYLASLVVADNIGKASRVARVLLDIEALVEDHGG